MKRFIKSIIETTKARRALLLCSLFVLSLNSSYAQALINYLPESAKSGMTKDQKHYYQMAMDSPFAMDGVLATIDLEHFDRNTVIFFYKDVPYTAHKLPRKGVPSNTRISWIGEIEGWNGMAHIVYNKAKQTVVGMIEAENTVFLIRPLGDGLHAIIGWDMTMEEGCLTPNNDFSYQGPFAARPGSTYGNQDIIQSQQEGQDGARVTGECNVRVLCAYTDDVDAAVADILSDVNNMINIANTGYENSEASPGGSISMRIELAATYEVAYNESGTSMNDDLDCITNTGDGCLDDIHTQRSLWRADQCVLLTNDGTGIAWVSTAYASQFSVTGRGNFYAHTFQHELGHNAECTHAINQAAQPGTAPYAGWGEPTTGCFRTVLAYSDACGTGSCSRHNIFSDDDSGQWNCGGTDYTPGTSNNRNQDRLNLSGPIIVGHQTVSTTVTYSGDYNWSTREAVHFVAADDVGYSSATNNFELFSGSEGSFRASNSVTLGEGFWARSGSNFTGYLESCSTLSRLRADANEDESPNAVDNVGQFEVQLYPNPFGSSTTLKFYLDKETEVFGILSDALGRTQQLIIDKGVRSIGWHTVEIDGSNLSAGIYHVALTADDRSVVKKIIKVAY